MKKIPKFISAWAFKSIFITIAVHNNWGNNSNLVERSHRSRNNSHKTRKMEWKQDSERRLRWESNPTSLERIVEIRLWGDRVEILEGEDRFESRVLFLCASSFGSFKNYIPLSSFWTWLGSLMQGLKCWKISAIFIGRRKFR